MGRLAKITLGGLAALATPLLGGACVNSCPDFKSPCAAHFDVAAWCGKTNCELDGKPAKYGGDPGAGVCLLDKGSVLSIPISGFLGSLKGRDLEVKLFSPGCGGVGGNALASAKLDGVVGVHSRPFGSNAEDVFRWDPFPDAPQTLELSCE